MGTASGRQIAETIWELAAANLFLPRWRLQMLKYPVTIFFFLLTVTQTFSKWCLIADYQANKDFIAKNLCVNRLKPCCCCKGRCFLNKKMAADESQQQTPGKGGQRDETVLYAHNPKHLMAAVAGVLIGNRFAARYVEGRLQKYSAIPFEPPRGTRIIC